MVLYKFFMVYAKRNFKISARKRHLLLLKLLWCWQINDVYDVLFNPSNLIRVQEINFPRTAGELLEYVQCLPIDGDCYNRFREQNRTTKQLLEESYTKPGS